MSRGRTRRPPVVDLDSYRFDLTVSQFAALLRNAGCPAHPRTIHAWLHLGYLHGYHPLGNREWRIVKASAVTFIEMRRRQLAA